MDMLFATFGSGNCFKAHLAYEQLNIAHNVRWIDVLKGEAKSPEYLSINPNGTVPYLLTDENKPIAESNAIAWYICQQSYLAPNSALEEAQTIDWMIFEQTKLEPFISPARFFTAIVPERFEDMEEQVKQWRRDADPGLSRLNQHLSINNFIVGNRYSVADIAVFGYTHVAHEGGIEMERYPAINKWIERVSNTSRYRQILEYRDAA